MTAALDSLGGGSGRQPARRRMVLVISESPVPNDVGAGPKMKDAALRAIDEGVVFDTFGLGDASLAEPPFPLRSIAGATGGEYSPVSDADELYCHLLRAVLEP